MASRSSCARSLGSAGTRIGTTSLSKALRSTCMAGGLTLALAGGALAGAAALPALASATPIALDDPNNGAAPMIAFDQVTQNTFIAWTDPQSTPNGGIDVCVLLRSCLNTSEGGLWALGVESFWVA